jgi:1-aminocyclopropane-1-carboxylate deaminase/D-cysteine desulfhydrase-like pyridoxal-dependent ACC family enzyme
VDLWIKRDDLTGFAGGGNKGRKLEYLIGDALEKNAEAVVTCGSLQSNFIRQLGAACAVAGLQCEAAVMELPYDEGCGQAPRPRVNHQTGNPLLDRLLGVKLRVFPDGDWLVLYEHADRLAAELESRGTRVYRIPIGGSSPLGAFAFTQAASELDQPFDWIVFASSSGSTHTGLAYAMLGTNTRVLGIACDPEEAVLDDFAEVAAGLQQLLKGPRALLRNDFRLDFRFVGPGYGVPSEGSLNAIRQLARSEGVLLDPIYSGKAYHGLCELIARGEVSGKILFWHTGGVPSLFAYPDVGL